MRLVQLVVLAAILASLAVQAQDVPAPTYRFPAQPLLFASEDQPPLTSLGFNLTQGGGEVTTAIPRVQVGRPFALTMFWSPQGPLAADLVLSLRFEGSGPTLTLETPLNPGPWSVGGVYRQTYPFTFPWLGYSGSGRLYASVVDASNEEHTLYALPMYLQAVPVQSPIAAAELTRAIDGDAVPIDTAFRLGRDAEVDVPLAGVADVFKELIVVSAVAYRTSTPNGAVVCDVDLLDSEGDVVKTGRIRYGQETFQADIDLYSPGAAARSGVTIFSSQPSGRTDADGQPLARHLYVGRVAFDGPPVRADALRFRYLLHEGVIDVRALAVVPANP